MSDQQPIPQRFLFQFPMYVLAVNCTYSQEKGGLQLHNKAEFAAPEYGGKPCLAFFMDSHAAEQFREGTDCLTLQVFPLTAGEVLRFLALCARDFRKIAIDPYHQAPRCKTVMLLPEFAREVQWYADRGE